MHIEGLQRCRPFLLAPIKSLQERSATGMRSMPLPRLISGLPSSKRLSQGVCRR
jgi:hypothetical protein